MRSEVPIPGSSRKDYLEEVDINVTFGEENGAHLRDLLKQHGLKLVPIDDGEVEVGNHSHHENGGNKLKLEVVKLQTIVSKHVNDLQKKDLSITELANTAKMLQCILDVLVYLDDDERERTKMKEKLRGTREREEILQQDLCKQHKFFEERQLQDEEKLKILQEQCTQLQQNLQSSEEMLKVVKTELQEVKDQISVDAVEKEKLLREKLDLKEKFQEERIKRNKEIIALSNEKERYTENQFRSIAFLRQLSECLSFPVGSEVDILSKGFLDSFYDHVKKSVKPSAEERSELLWSRDVVNQLENLLSTRRGRCSTSTATTSTLGTVVVNGVSSVVPPVAEQTDIFTDTNITTGEYEATHLVTNLSPMSPTRPHSSQSSSTVTPPKSPKIQETDISLSTEATSGVFIQAGLELPLNPLTSPKAPHATPTKKAKISPTPRVIAPQRSLQVSPPPPITPARVSAVPESSPPTSTSITETSPSHLIPSPPETVILRTPKVEPDDDVSSTVGRTPSIIVPLAASQTSPQTSSTSSQPKRKRPNVNTDRAYRQFTEFAITTKRHAVDHDSPQFRCTCENTYKTERGLLVHIRKMTQEWKYKCDSCKQYFFYKSNLNRHIKTTKCGDTAPFDLDDFLRDPPQQFQKRKPAQSQSEQKYSPTGILIRGPSATPSKGSLRKLQQEILKRKKHAPWISKVGKGTVQGSWYCKCLSKFKSRETLMVHVQYWSKDWKFKCRECEQKFFYMSYLKKHMASAHKISNALGEYSVGCHLCGKMFQNRKEYYRHRKQVHNIHQSPKRRTDVDKPRTLKYSSKKSQAPTIATTAPPPNIVREHEVEIIDVPSDDESDSEVVIVEELPTINSTPSCSPTKRTEQSPSPPQSKSSSKHRRKEKTQRRRDSTIKETNGVRVDPEPECKKKFMTKKKLKRHLYKMHTGKFMRCQLCSESFRELDHLKCHMVKEHNEIFKSFLCVFCNKIFSSAKDYAMHRFQVLREHHFLQD